MERSLLLTKMLNTTAENGLHIMGRWGAVFQIMPPITIAQTDLDQGLDVLIGAVNACS